MSINNYHNYQTLFLEKKLKEKKPSYIKLSPELF